MTTQGSNSLSNLGLKFREIIRMHSASPEKLLLVFVLLATVVSQSACVAVGYSNRGGWFIWPGSLGLLVIVLLLYFVFGRRR